MADRNLVSQFENGLLQSFSLMEKMTSDERVRALECLHTFLKSNHDDDENDKDITESINVEASGSEQDIDPSLCASETSFVANTSGEPICGFESQLLGEDNELINLRIIKLEEDIVEFEDIEANSDLSDWKTVQKAEKPLDDPDVVETIRVVVGPNGIKHASKIVGNQLSSFPSATPSPIRASSSFPAPSSSFPAQSHSPPIITAVPRLKTEASEKVKEQGECVVYYGGLPEEPPTTDASPVYFHQSKPTAAILKKNRKTGTESPKLDTSQENVQNVQKDLPPDVTSYMMIRRRGHTMQRTNLGHWLCETCGKGFPLKAGAIGHLRVHTKERPYSCTVCPRTFSFPANRDRHLREVHRFMAQFECSLCSAVYSSKRLLKNHLHDQHGKSLPPKDMEEYSCKKCDKTYTCRSSFVSHCRQIHQMPEEGYVCEICKKRFNFQSNLIRHMKIHSGERPHECDRCQAAFIEKRSLQLHKIRVHNCEKTKALIEYGNKYVCQTCDKHFTSKGNYKLHQLVHTGEMPHKCPYCARAFSLKSNLKRHERIHKGERPFVCLTCFKSFSEKRSMEIHMRTHTGEKPYKCETCHKQFAQLSTLQSHKPVHDKVRSFNCKKCPATFLRRSHLSVHKRKHRSSGVFRCNLCDFSTNKTVDLFRHANVHLHSKVYSCEDCKERFSNLHDLDVHILNHGQDKFFRCHLCSQIFSDVFSCNNHQQMEHGDEMEAVISASTAEEFDPNEYIILPADDIPDELLDVTGPDTFVYQDQDTASKTMQHVQSTSQHETDSSTLSTRVTDGMSATETLLSKNTDIMVDLTEPSLSTDFQKVFFVSGDDNGKKQNYYFVVQ